VLSIIVCLLVVAFCPSLLCSDFSYDSKEKLVFCARELTTKSQKSLMIPNGYPEAVKWRTEKKTKCQAMEYKKLHRILKIEQHEPNRKTGGEPTSSSSGARRITIK
jgi:hypothetical protein